MPWITPTEATVKARITGPEFDALKSAALGAGQNATALVAGCLTRTTTLVRSYVGKKYKLGIAGTIPDELESAFGSLWVYDFLSRLPGENRVSESRADNYKEAMRQLRDASSGAMVIVEPLTPAPDNQQTSGPGIQVVSSSPRQNTSAQLDGLL